MSPTEKKMPSYTDYTFDMFITSAGKEHAEITQFNKWRQQVLAAHMYTFQVGNLEEGSARWKADALESIWARCISRLSG